MSIISTIQYGKMTERKSKRVGRGYGSGKGGHTSGRGQKGQKSRGSSKIKVGFAGRQTTLHEQLPKFRGSARRNIGVRAQNGVVNLADISKYYSDGEVVSVTTLRNKGLVSSKHKTIKLLGQGNIDKKVKIEKGILLSKPTIEKLKKANIQIEDEA